jgi:hypothetical protein
MFDRLFSISIQQRVLFPRCVNVELRSTRRWSVVFSLSLVASACGEHGPVGPEPIQGFDERPVDYDAPEHPDVPTVNVPLFSVHNSSELPFVVEFPAVQTGKVIALTGEIEHPNPQVSGALVQVAFYGPPSRGQTEKSRSIGGQDFAKGDQGRLAYRIEVHTPERTGRYAVQIEVQHPIVAPNIDSLPIEERMTKTVVAEGELVVTR